MLDTHAAEPGGSASEPLRPPGQKAKITSLGELLREIPPEEYQRRLDEGKLVASRCHDYYPNEIRPAIQFLADVRAGAQKILVASPMQSGKTNIMACVMVLARALLPSDKGHRVRGVYICANNQIDFRQQACGALAHHMEVLTLSDRRRWVDDSTVPLIVFFDESHFGDGDTMTISDFLNRHQVFDTRRHLIFCGVSATPFSHMGQLDADILPDLTLLEEMSYNSVGMMLERGRIVEADALFVDEEGNRSSGRAANDPDAVFINRHSNVYRHIARVMARKEVDGYGLIRCSKAQASVLSAHLKETFGHRIMVINWNQHQKMVEPKTYFAVRRYGVLTICLVQHKARMGNQIDTRHFHLMYETSPSGNVDTISQSFMGRACGFLKQDHKCVVYSHVAIAKIYDSIMGREPSIDLFHELCARHSKRPGMRAELSYRPGGFEIDHIETIAFPRSKEGTELVRRKVIALQQKHFKLLTQGRGSVRRLSRWDPTSPRPLGVSVKSAPGSWAIGVHDRHIVDGKYELNDIIHICLHVRSNRRSLVPERVISPKHTSLYSGLSGRPKQLSAF